MRAASNFETAARLAEAARGDLVQRAAATQHDVAQSQQRQAALSQVVGKGSLTARASGLRSLRAEQAEQEKLEAAGVMWAQTAKELDGQIHELERPHRVGGVGGQRWWRCGEQRAGGGGVKRQVWLVRCSSCPFSAACKLGFVYGIGAA